MINQRVPVITRTERKRLAFLVLRSVAYFGIAPPLFPFAPMKLPAPARPPMSE